SSKITPKKTAQMFERDHAKLFPDRYGAGELTLPKIKSHEEFSEIAFEDPETLCRLLQLTPSESSTVWSLVHNTSALNAFQTLLFAEFTHIPISQLYTVTSLPIITLGTDFEHSLNFMIYCSQNSFALVTDQTHKAQGFFDASFFMLPIEFTPLRPEAGIF